MCEESKQFDVSPKMKKLFDAKQKQRAIAKEYFQKVLYNPYRPINDPPPFDAALQRFSALSAYNLEYFEPTAKSHFRDKNEKLIRSGAVRYEDRPIAYIF